MQGMSEATFTCPRCFHAIPLRSEVRFCPHCGLADAMEAAADTSPLDLSAGPGRTYRVLDRVAFGSICNIYRCGFQHAGKTVEGLLKVARDARANGWVGNEADILTRLRQSDSSARYGPFLPEVLETISVGSGSAARRANLLKLDDAFGSPDFDALWLRFRSASSWTSL